MTQATKRRRSFSLRGLFAVVTIACIFGWGASKWREATERDRIWDSMFAKSAVNSYQWKVDDSSTSWPFRESRRMGKIWLMDGNFTDDDVRQLRRIFPGVTIYHQSASDLRSPDQAQLLTPGEHIVAPPSE